MDANSHDALQTRLKTLQMICMALIMGVAIFAAIVAVMTVAPPPGGTAPPTTQAGGPAPALRYVAGMLTITGCVAAFVLTMPRGRTDHRLIQPMHRTDAPADLYRMFGRFFSKRLAAYAILEAPALLGAVLTLLSSNLNDLAFVAVPLVCMLLIFPTAGKWDRFASAIPQN